MPFELWPSNSVGATPSPFIPLAVMLLLAVLLWVLAVLNKSIRTVTLNPATSGLLGSALALAVTLQPAITQGWLRYGILAAAVLLVMWGLVTLYGSTARERANKRRRFAREAFRFAREVYNLIDESKSVYLELAAAGGWDPYISSRLKRAQGRACSEYGRRYWIPLRNFFDELKDEGFISDWRVQQARELANEIEQYVFAHDDWEAVMKIEEMGARLDCEVGTALRQREPFFQWPWHRAEPLGD